MAMKHLVAYYNEVGKQYCDLKDELREYEEYAKTHIVPPDIMDNLEALIAPLKQNYERLTYVMFLLNQPNRKSKQPAYERRMAKAIKGLSETNSLEAVVKENDDVLQKLKETMKE